ncbi:MAG: HAD family hydrolase [Butyricicoccaceae bacterium]
MSRILQGVVFDMDGLLLDSERYVKLSWDLGGERIGWGALGHNIVNTLGMNHERRRAYYAETYGEEFPYDRFCEAYRAAFRELTQESGVPMKEGGLELMQFLQEHGVKMAVATSSSHDYAMRNLQRVGFWEYLDGAVTGGMVTNSKPHPESYLKACEILQLDPQHCLALEDAPGGIRAAHAAGLYPVMIPDLVQDSSAVDALLFAKVDCLKDVIALIRDNFQLPK